MEPLPTPVPRVLPFRLAAALAAVLLGFGCQPTPNPDAPAAAPRTYLGREIAPPMGHAADWMERPSREATEFPDRILDALALADTMRVADVGAGTGYLTFRLAPRLPRGKVFAIDIDPQMLAVLTHRRDSLGAANVAVVRGTAADPGLAAASVDVALIVDSYHEFSDPEAMGRALVRALRPGGRLVLVEYRAEDATVPVDSLHRMSAEQMRREMAALGLRQVASHDVLPQQHLLVFGR